MTNLALLADLIVEYEEMVKEVKLQKHYYGSGLSNQCFTDYDLRPSDTYCRFCNLISPRCRNGGHFALAKAEIEAAKEYLAAHREQRSKRYENQIRARELQAWGLHPEQIGARMSLPVSMVAEYLGVYQILQQHGGEK